MDELWVDVKDTDPRDRVSAILPGATVEISSKYDTFYNCAAWAVGDTRHIWDPDAYWPPGGFRGGTVSDLSRTYGVLGFEPCGLDASLDPTFDKIAITEKDGEWAHVCKQCEDGRWWSKLGDSEDVKHALEDIELQPDYGKIALILRKSRRASALIASNDSADALDQ